MAFYTRFVAVSPPSTLPELAMIAGTLLLILIAGVVCVSILRRSKRRHATGHRPPGDKIDPWREAARRLPTPTDQDD
ncbi:MAG: hypothetical protein MK077_03745 [Phycisphaerales bacterium]|nr:hypothetical protein [Phycisphaerales bacterium]